MSKNRNLNWLLSPKFKDIISIFSLITSFRKKKDATLL